MKSYTVSQNDKSVLGQLMMHKKMQQSTVLNNSINNTKAPIKQMSKPIMCSVETQTEPQLEEFSASFDHPNISQNNSNESSKEQHSEIQIKKQVPTKEESKIRYTFEAENPVKKTKARFTNNPRKIDEARYYLGFDKKR